MARPSKFNRDDALETVMQILWRDGYETSSIKALSETLGITRSSFYNAFGTREDLFKEVIARYFDQTPDKPLAEATEAAALKPLLTRTFRSICRVRAADPEGRGCLAVNSAASLCGSHEVLGPFMAGCIEASLERIEMLVTWAVARGELPKDTDIRGTALAVQNLLVGINVLAKVVRDEDDLWATAKTTLRALDLYEESA